MNGRNPFLSRAGFDYIEGGEEEVKKLIRSQSLFK